jgi:hypothetical protein
MGLKMICSALLKQFTSVDVQADKVTEMDVTKKTQPVIIWVFAFMHEWCYTELNERSIVQARFRFCSSCNKKTEVLGKHQ